MSTKMHLSRLWETLTCFIVVVKAFTFHSTVKAKRLQARSAEKDQRRLHVPMVDHSSGEPPPFVIVVQGPPQFMWICSRVCGQVGGLRFGHSVRLRGRKKDRPYLVGEKSYLVGANEHISLRRKCHCAVCSLYEGSFSAFTNRVSQSALESHCGETAKQTKLEAEICL